MADPQHEESFSAIRFTTRFFFISNTFISNAKLKLAKNQANAKQHPEVERLTSYWHSSSTLSSNNSRACSKKNPKEQACLYSWDYAIYHNENEDENENRLR